MVARGSQRESSIDFAPLVRALRRQGGKCLLVALVAGLLAYPLIRMLPQHYTAHATLLLKAQPDNITPLPQVSGYDASRSDYYQTQYALMQSRSVLMRVINTQGLLQDPAFNGGLRDDGPESLRLRQANALEHLRQNLTVSGVRGTQLVSIAYESTSPSQAAQIANAVTQAYLAENVAQKQRKTLAARDWNQRQMREVRAQVDAQKAQIEAYLKQQGILTFRGVDGFQTEELGIVTNRLADATQRRIAAQAQYDEVRQAVAGSLENALSVPAIADHAQIQDLRIALIQTERSLYELRKRYGPDHLQIRQAQAQAQVAAVQSQLHQVLTELVEGIHRQYLAAQDDERRYRQMLTQQKVDFQGLTAKRDRYNSMQTTLNKTEELYKSLYQRAQELTLSDSLEQADAEIVDPAIAPVHPAKPNRTLLLAMVITLALTIALLFSVVRAALDTRIYTLSQLARRLRLTPLGELRVFDDAGDGARLAQAIMSNPAEAEAPYAMRTRLLLASPPAQVLALVSADAREGRSLCAALLARAFSADRRTLLIDMDYLNDDGLSTALAPASDAGLAPWVMSDADAPPCVPLSGQLDFLPRGTLNGSALLLLSSPQLAQRLTELRRRYAQIVIDLPALSQAQDSRLGAALADACVTVVQAGRLPTPPLIQALAALDGLPQAGVILNRVTRANLESREALRALSVGMALTLPATKP
ncbi:polysaccharide biosynthesis tyrosine autokinase [Edwardsiella piscicida]|nr:polysaccharide biosynthesis tyrosine autokinase [Edwardsiella piscicida]ELM3729493.1 polysaccharide biosynthesis tyrosine autokinase [Edwardsiella piscicida]ELV7537063.1 polysaccharide biosynthesis tyrosine autokinase [Edwardsiella piscicida]